MGHSVTIQALDWLVKKSHAINVVKS